MTVVGSAGQSVVDVAITRIHVPTGAVLEPAVFEMLEAGRYVAVDGGMLAIFSGDGDVARVIGEQAGTSVRTVFVFAAPDPCRCHLIRLAGSDTVTIG